MIQALLFERNKPEIGSKLACLLQCKSKSEKIDHKGNIDSKAASMLWSFYVIGAIERL